MSEAQAAAERWLDHLADDLPLDQVAFRRQELDELVTHVTSSRRHPSDPSPLLLIQANWLGMALNEAGDVPRAIALCEQTLTDRERVLGADHPLTQLMDANLKACLSGSPRTRRSGVARL